MTKYNVEQMLEIWLRVSVEADSLEEAIELAQIEIKNGGGVETTETAQYTDSFWVENTETGDVESIHY